MKKLFDKIGYSLYIGIYIFLVISYGKFVLYETIYLVFGDSVEGTVLEQSITNDKTIYRFSYFENQVSKTCISTPTKTRLNLKDSRTIRVVPFLNIALLYSFNFIAYFASMAFFLFGLVISFICMLFLFNIKNRVTLRILKNRSAQGDI